MSRTAGPHALLLALLGAAACGDPAEPDDAAAIERRLVDRDTGAPVLGRVTGFPDLGAVSTSSPGATFRLEGARFGVRYRLLAEAQGYLEAETTVVPSFTRPEAVRLSMVPAIACTAGARRCARGGQEGVETCTADGRGFAFAACAPGEVCADAVCVGAPTLTVAVEGSGSVVSVPSGILCAPDCERAFPVGTEVRLEARPFGDAELEAWGGDCAGTDGPVCTLALDGDRDVQVRFRTVAYRLTVDTRGGAGTVLSQPEGIDCPGGACDAFFPADADVVLTAAPGDGLVLARWERACESAGAAPSCTVRMDRARRVRARFARPGPVLTVTKEGAGAGRVVSDPNGIDCGDECASGFEEGSTVTLEATPQAGSRFEGWGGACSGAEPICAVQMSGARDVTARFEGDVVEVSVNRTGGGQGTVASTPAGIDCGGTCAADFPRGASLRLDAAPASGSVLFAWGADCASAGFDPACTLSPGGPASVEARFEPFFFVPLPADADCAFGLAFDGASPLASTCSAETASAPDWTSTPSRTPRLGDAVAAPSPGRPMALTTLAGGAPFTAELSVRPSRVADAVLWTSRDRRDPAARGLELRLLPDGALSAATFDGAGNTSSATTAAGQLVAGGWTHVAVVGSGAGLAVFVEGQEQARDGGALVYAASSTVTWIGAARTGTVADGFFEGAVDEVRFSGAARYP